MKYRFTLATLALFIGGMIYVCCRSECLVMFTRFEQLGIGSLISFLRASTGSVFGSLPAWVRMSLPNALWLFSGLLFLDCIWDQRYTLDKVLWLAVFWFSAVGSEFAQGFGVLPGTFDPQDFLLMVVATVLAALLTLYPKANERIVKPCPTSAS